MVHFNRKTSLNLGISALIRRFKWQEKGALQLNPYIVLPQFEIKGFKLKDCTKHYTSGHVLQPFSLLQQKIKRD